MQEEQREYYTTDELAKLLRVSRTTILRYIDDGLIKAIRIGRTVRIPASEVRRLTSPTSEETSGDSEASLRGPASYALA